MPEICPDCGSDTYKDRYFDRLSDKLARLEQEYRRQAAHHAVEHAKWELAEFDRQEDRKGLQRKVQEQRRTIKRLEAKVRKHGVQPYAADDAEAADG